MSFRPKWIKYHINSSYYYRFTADVKTIKMLQKDFNEGRLIILHFENISEIKHWEFDKVMPLRIPRYVTETRRAIIEWL